MDKENVVYTYKGVLFKLKKKEMLQFVSIWMNLVPIMISEMSATHGQILHDFTYIRYLK